ncbi:MAG TPA: hypothetical protein VGM73_01085 [Candidatus Didemnitutus sp.]|jgi:hypothetical protein
MTVTQELERLSALHTAGQLSDREFAAAKQQIVGEVGQPASLPHPTFQERVFRSSRWSAGNFLFPDRLTVAPDGIVFRKGAMFGSREEHIGYGAIASYRTDNGVFLATMRIETSGGTQPIVINGLWKSSARKMQELIRLGQAGRSEAG